MSTVSYLNPQPELSKKSFVYLPQAAAAICAHYAFFVHYCLPQMHQTDGSHKLSRMSAKPGKEVAMFLVSKTVVSPSAESPAIRHDIAIL